MVVDGDALADTGANDLFDESSLAHLDSLVYGREYLAVGSGDCGTDDCPPLISVESPLDMTLMWDARLRMGYETAPAPDHRLNRF